LQLIVATSNAQVPYLDALQTLSCDPRLRQTDAELSVSQNDSVVPAYFLSGEEARDMEPDLSNDVKGALLVTETGIVDSQGLVDSLAREIEEEEYLTISKAEKKGVGLSGGNMPRGEGVVVLGTRVVRVDREERGDGWVVQLETGWEGLGEGQKGDVESVRADVVVNAAGLGAASLLEGVVPEKERVQMWPVKGEQDREECSDGIGNYMSYKGPGVSSISRLIYPCPSGNIDTLGTHLVGPVEAHAMLKKTDYRPRRQCQVRP
jgi:L-2-hydroxyglutarate oxidase LhgO